MNGRLFAQIISLMIFVATLATTVATFLTDWAVYYPGLARYAAIAAMVAGLITPLLPRIQTIGKTLGGLVD